MRVRLSKGVLRPRFSREVPVLYVHTTGRKYAQELLGLPSRVRMKLLEI